MTREEFMSRIINITRLKDRIEFTEKQIKEINGKAIIRESRPRIKLGTRYIEIKKALIKPNFNNKTVLTDSTWDYVLTYLQTHGGSTEHIFYWEQAKNFYDATLQLSIISKPLTTYYCFLNAAKALLEFKGIDFDYRHGVSGTRHKGHIILQNELIKIHPSGVLPGLCKYFEEPISDPETFTLKEILYNLHYIHRAYTLTFPRATELYIPIIDPQFVYDSDRKKGWFQTKLERDYSNKTTLNKLVGFNIDNYYSSSYEYTIRRNKTFIWDCSRNKPSAESLKSFNNYYKKLRTQLQYIYSPNELWYIKRTDTTNKIIRKNSLILTMAAMHKLSELSRYEPQTLKKLLEKDQSWLLSEFINKSIVQFIDNISSEITGDDFRQTGFRT